MNQELDITLLGPRHRRLKGAQNNKARLGRMARNALHRARPKLRVAHNPPLAHLTPLNLELGLDENYNFSGWF